MYSLILLSIIDWVGHVSVYNCITHGSHWTYQQPSDQSNEGTTQGDSPESGWCALSAVPIIEHLNAIKDENTGTKFTLEQAWFADDSSAA